MYSFVLPLFSDNMWEETQLVTTPSAILHIYILWFVPVAVDTVKKLYS